MQWAPSLTHMYGTIHNAAMTLRFFEDPLLPCESALRSPTVLLPYPLPLPPHSKKEEDNHEKGLPPPLSFFLEALHRWLEPYKDGHIIQNVFQYKNYLNDLPSSINNMSKFLLIKYYNSNGSFSYVEGGIRTHSERRKEWQWKEEEDFSFLQSQSKQSSQVGLA